MSEALVVTRTLLVPSLPRISGLTLYPSHEEWRTRHERVFDAWAWCASDYLHWGLPSGGLAFDKEQTLDGSNPAELAFVFHEGAECTFLPRELACFHARGYGLEKQWALAPYGIDDATDELYARGIRPRDALWLAAPSLRALVWGLHDWAHFHNHGPFDEPAMTEFECDMVALEWLRRNQTLVGLSDDEIARVAQSLADLSRSRFATEGLSPPGLDLDALFYGPYPAPRT